MIKKIIFICMLSLLGVTLIACGGTKDSAPTITNGDETYLSVTEGGVTYSFDKKTVYDLLKNSYVVSTLFSLIDEDLLNKEKVNNVSYLDMVTETEVFEAIEEATFENGKEDLTEDEIRDLEDLFEERMFSSGYRTQDEIKNYYKLEVAREKYAREMLEKEILEKDAEAEKDSEKYFPENKILGKYNSLYSDSYFAIIVKYNTAREVNDALAQLGVKIIPQDVNVAGSYSKWVWIENELELTVSDTIQTMIDLYNSQNSYRVSGYPDEFLSLVEGVQYTINDGKYQFNKIVSEDNEALNELNYTQGELIAINKGVLTEIKTTLNAYNPMDSKVDSSQKWFTNTIKSLDSGNLQYLAMKISTVDKSPLEDVRDEIIELLKEEVLTVDYISKQMVKLRSNYEIVIYDKDIEDYYLSQAENADVEFKTSKKTSKNVIAEIDGVEYTTDQVFEIMNDRYGMNFISNQINYERLLSNKELNTVYDYTGRASFDKNKVLDKTAWESLDNDIIKLKQEFESGQYAAMGWENYIKYIYQVQNEHELKLYLLYEDLGQKFIDEIYGVKDISEDSEIWDLYLYNMQQRVDEYYNVTGYHLLISVNDSNGKPINPIEWTEYQKILAEELDQQVKVYLENTTGKHSDKFAKIALEFAKSPRFVAKTGFVTQPDITNLDYNLDNIEISKFKSAGLTVKYEDLGSFENGKMVEAFSNAMLDIWNSATFTDGIDESTVIYGVDVSLGEYIISEFGYHVYVNTKSTDIPKWMDINRNKHILPTFDQIQMYLVDKENETLSKEVLAAIEKYFNPLLKELTSETIIAVELIKEQKSLNIDFKIDAFTIEDFNRFLDINLKQLEEQLTYKTSLPI